MILTIIVSIVEVSFHSYPASYQHSYANSISFIFVSSYPFHIRQINSTIYIIVLLFMLGGKLRRIEGIHERRWPLAIKSRQKCLRKLRLQVGLKKATIAIDVLYTVIATLSVD